MHQQNDDASADSQPAGVAKLPSKPAASDADTESFVCKLSAEKLFEFRLLDPNVMHQIGAPAT